MEEIRQELKYPFEYAVKGDMVTASFVTMTAPTFKQLDKFTPIKQAFTAAVTEISESVTTTTESEEKQSDEEMKPAAVMQVMHAWSGNLVGIFLHAEQLFKSGAAMVDGDLKLTSDLMAKMALSDFEALVGAYIANFIARSLLDGQ